MLLDKLSPDSVMASSRSEENVVLTTFSSDLEEAMTESGESLSNSKNYCSVFEKISKIKENCMLLPLLSFLTTFSSDLEEAMTESGESLSNSKNYCSVFEKISKINDVKQNEKHPFTYNFLT